MSTRATIIQSSSVDPNPKGAALFTSAELALLLHTDLTAWLDWKTIQRDANNYVTRWMSHKLGVGGVEQMVTTTDVANGLVYYPTTDNQYGLRSGYLNTGVANSNHNIMRGNSAFVLPSASSWYVADLGAYVLPATTSCRWATGGATTQFAKVFDVSGRVRRYSDFSGTLSGQSATLVNDAALHLWEDTYDGATLVSYKDRTSVISSAVSLPSYSDMSIRLNHVNNGGSEGSLQSGYCEMFVVGTNSSSLRSAVRAVVAERHPGLSLA